ncbi:hypothetical protein NC99_28300 [Sunxiuqinia dokdonensis]|uniref:Uncharacterized protein n=1 Tax=Sunxiuqinia dokdonensis TaxID=1409788 RepID=A0A0L8V7Q1_9BACT|nr:hypothetical protein NC99_28300 [Sunxiuqinia dokdonensis]
MFKIKKKHCSLHLNDREKESIAVFDVFENVLCGLYIYR